MRLVGAVVDPLMANLDSLVKVSVSDYFIDIFPWGTVKKDIHFIVYKSSPVSSRKRLSSQTDSRPPKKTNIDRRNQNLSKHQKDTHSAYLSRSSAVAQVYKAILGGRPMDHFGHPPALYHPTLATLQMDIQDLDQEAPLNINESNRAMFECTRGFFAAAAAFSDDEHILWRGARPFFEHVFGLNYHRKPLVPESKDALRSDIFWNNPQTAILEAKPGHVGSGGATLQAVKAYIVSCNPWKADKYFKFSTMFPVILAAIMGNILEISIVITLEEVHFQQILHLELFSNDDDRLSVPTLVRIGNALKTCMKELEKEYSQLRSVPIPESEAR